MTLFDNMRTWFRREPPLPPAGAVPNEPDTYAAAAKELIEMAEQADTFEKRYVGELFELEAAIITVYKGEPDLTDRHVDNALEAVVDAVRAKQLGRASRAFNLSAQEQKVFELVWDACETLQGQPQRVDLRLPNPFPHRICNAQDVADCLKRIRKSIRYWSKNGEPQEYLEFVAAYYIKIHGKVSPPENA